jgi:hypothetical protein
LRAGASGFLLKDAPADQLVTAIRIVAAGEALLAPSITRRLIEEFTRRPPSNARPAELEVLSPRELDVLLEPMIDADKARLLLDVLVSRKGKAFTNRAWIAGLRLAPNDLDWSWGDGPEISGTAEAIIMSLGGRTAAFADLSGAGADEFRARAAQK